METYNRIAGDVQLGEGARVFGFANLYGCTIGARTKIGTYVEVQKNAHIGEDCKISSHSFICEGVRIGDRVFVGHNVTFINDRFPRAANLDGSLQTDADWEVVPTVIEDEAAIGSSVTLLCGVRIGRRAVIGAGSVVTRDVPPGQVWAGNPARYLRDAPDASA